MDKISKLGKMITVLKKAATDKLSDTVITSIHSWISPSKPVHHKVAPSPQSEPPIQPKPLTPAQRAIQAFLASSNIDGYADPFLDLDVIHNMPDSQTIAHHINKAMCMIRYLCKGDPLFCQAALEEMLKTLSSDETPDNSVCALLQVGSDSVRSESFLNLFEANPHEAWNHLHIMSVHEPIGFDEFIGLIQALFNTAKAPYDKEISHISHTEDTDIDEWVRQCNEVIAPQDLILVELKCRPDTRNFALLKAFEFKVFLGMLGENHCEAICAPAYRR